MRAIAIVLLALASSARAEPVFESLGDDAYLLRGEFVAGRQPDGNSVVLVGKAGLVVVDSGRHREHTQRIVEFARARELPIQHVVNTHWHLDHVGGNPVLKRTYPRLQVHASNAIVGAMSGFLARYRSDLQAQLAGCADDAGKAAWQAELALIDAGEALYPDAPVGADGSVEWAGRTLQVHLATHAVTEGDVWLYQPQARLLVAGDLVTLPAPLLDTACPARWQQTLRELEQVDFRTLIPGHGAAMTRRDLMTYREGFDHLLACAASDASADQCTVGWMATLGELIPESDRPLARDLLGYYLNQVLRGDPTPIAQRCAEP